MIAAADFHADDFLSDYPNDTEVLQELYDPLSDGVPMGAYCLSRWILHLMVTIDTFIFVLGIVGNAIICTVIVCSKSMHTPTNCYLFSLSMSDLLLLVTGAPHEIYELYYPNTFYAGPIGCTLRYWLAEIAVNVSVITITAFTYERYLAICQPFKAHAMSQVSRVKKLIIAIWLLAVFTALPVSSQHRYKERDDGSITCEFDERIIPHSVEVITTLLFFLPMTVITVMYILIGMSLMRATKMEEIGLNGAQVHGRADESTKRTVQMLVIIVLAFFLCWAPFHVQRLMTSHFNDVGRDMANIYDKIYCIVTHVSGITYLLSAVINPLIYSIMSSKFRDAFEELLFSTGKKFCHANYYRWRKTWNVAKNVDSSATNDIPSTLRTVCNNNNV